jgi:hypothetical protein
MPGTTLADRDFRAAAVAATRRELGVSKPLQLESLRRSAVVAYPNDELASMRRASLIDTVAFFMAIPLGLFACALAVWPGLAGLIGGERFAGVSVPSRIAAAVGLLGFSVGLGWWAGTRYKRRIAKLIARRPKPIGFDHSEIVTVEPVETHGRFKLVSDDSGVLWYDLDGGRLMVDGVSHRYLICRDDVHDLQPTDFTLGCAVRIEMSVGTTRFAFVVGSMQPDKHDIENQPSLSAREWFARNLALALGISHFSAAGDSTDSGN